jgi:hypothetical protein
MAKAGDRASGKARATLAELAGDRPPGAGGDPDQAALAATMPEGATRLVSVHDPDARPIDKGRLGRPVEFGYRAQVLDNAAAWCSTMRSSAVWMATPRSLAAAGTVIQSSSADSGTRG